LEALASQVVDLVNEGKRPVAESIAHAVREVNSGVTEEQAAVIAVAVIAEAQKICFPNWWLKSDVKSDLFLAITTTLVQQFKDAALHTPATGFVERVVRLLEKTRFVGKPDEGNAS
jgi:type I restriction enzyme, R subunit